MQPTIGRIVRYTLTEADADAINRRRADFEAFQRTILPPRVSGTGGATGHQAHVGNRAQAGQTYPAMVVRVFDPSATTANLQVSLDGNDTYWATSRTEGDGEGHWVWPPRV
ncbi:hypothetical protein [Actinomadura montaniterrae]|uniref:Uncharacterized protein n=1 Tax=Actinomadura montaniterrae TaxID=1803903 RepID=A0A6L3W2L8_9ACTN|nr:hypothetical protein [Actinomadura montaniterrae]KAB2384747.1 hypothetical protein F9B16_09880 [Actinomadura montaniterrae]